MIVFVLVIAVSIVTLMFILMQGTTMTAKWKQRWPAISEEEFLAKCEPGVNRQRALKVRRIISEQLGIPYEHIHPDQRFIEDLHCD